MLQICLLFTCKLHGAFLCCSWSTSQQSRNKANVTPAGRACLKIVLMDMRAQYTYVSLSAAQLQHVPLRGQDAVDQEHQQTQKSCMRCIWCL